MAAIGDLGEKKRKKERIENKKIKYLEVLFANLVTSIVPRQSASGPRLLEIALTLLIGTISAHCKQPTQYQWIFTISEKNSGFSNFML
jgi:hypothetical protein